MYYKNKSHRGCPARYIMFRLKFFFAALINEIQIHPRMAALLFKLTTLVLFFFYFSSIQSSFATHPSSSTNLRRRSSSSSLISHHHHHPHNKFSVTDYGAIGDGKHYDTPHIQAAIDDCYSSGGGYVVFPKGNYLTATIFLRSGVVLDVRDEAIIYAGTRLEDYPLENERWYLILAENASDVGITGDGIINGQGWEFVVKKDEKKNVMVSWNQTGACSGDECRPRLVGFLDCRNVKIWGILLTQSAYWCLHLVRCDNTWINDTWVTADFNNPNNDAIDITDSNNTVISNVFIDTGDDAICPKTYTTPLHNLTVTDADIRTKSSAIKLGSASWYDFKGLVFDRINIYDSHRALAFQLRDGGSASDITFSNVKINTRYYDPSWWGRAEPIYVTTCPRDSNSKVGSISNLTFMNITAESENGIFLSGSSEGLLRGIKLINVKLNLSRWTDYEDGLVDYRPGCRGLVNHSTAGIIMEYIDGLEIVNMNMSWTKNNISRGWDNPLDFNPATVNRISLVSFNSGISSI